MTSMSSLDRVFFCSIVSLHYCCCLFNLSLIFPCCHRSTKTHPGPVVHLSDSPKDEGKVSRQIKTAPGSPQAPTLMLQQSTKAVSFSLLPCLQLNLCLVTHLSSTLPSACLVSSFFLSFYLPFFLSHFPTSRSLSLAHRKKNSLYTLHRSCFCSRVLFSLSLGFSHIRTEEKRCEELQGSMSFEGSRAFQGQAAVTLVGKVAGAGCCKREVIEEHILFP